VQEREREGEKEMLLLIFKKCSSSDVQQLSKSIAFNKSSSQVANLLEALHCSLLSSVDH